MIHICDAPQPIQSRSNVFLPFIGTGEPKRDILQPEARAFYDMLVADRRQEHPQLIVTPSLIQSATWRAHGLANGDPWLHCDSQGRCANWYARAAGCQLPSFYPDNANQIETLGAGSNNPGIIFAALAASKAHADHLFGRGWFVHQIHIGIGMVENMQSAYKWYWSIHICLCIQESNE